MKQCKCGQDAKLLKVKKEGANFDRPFYACAKPRDEQCDFFEWADVKPYHKEEAKTSIDTQAILDKLYEQAHDIIRAIEDSTEEIIKACAPR